MKNSFEQFNFDNDFGKKELINKIKLIEEFIDRKKNSITTVLKKINFNLNNPTLEGKVDRLLSDVKDKFFTKEDLSDDFIKLIKRKIMKIALEDLAENEFGGSLSLYEDLESYYSDILTEEALLIINNDNELIDKHDSIYINDLCKSLNEKSILDKKQQGLLFAKIKSGLEE